MRYSESTIEDIRMGNDIIDIIGKYTRLSKSGDRYMGLCPFHNESTPSFSVSADKQLYHCFGCGASGNVISFVMQKENYDFVETIKYLADRIHYELPEENYERDYAEKVRVKDILYEIHKKAARHFYDNLNSDMGAHARRYLDGREIIKAVRNKYGIGYAEGKNDIYNFLKKEGYEDDIIEKSGLVVPDKNGGFRDKFYDRVMFPIFDIRGRIVAFGGRTLEEGKKTAKYLNSPETPIFSKSYNLYSINYARASGMKEFILVEGYMDVISLYQNGFCNAVAALGTAFNDNHAGVLKKYANSVIILFDSDEAGTKAALNAINVLVKNGIKAKVLQVKDAKDPDEYLKKFGREAFAQLLKTAKSYVLFQIESKKKKYDMSDMTQKIDFTKEAAKMIKNFDSEIEREVYIEETSKMSGVSKEAIGDEVKKLSDNTLLNMNQKRYMKEKYKTNISGVDDARQSLLYIMATNRNIYNNLREYIKKEELMEDIYIKLFDMIKEKYKSGEEIYPAELVSCFENIDEQNTISKIFMLRYEFNDIASSEKAVNDQVKLIKKVYYESILAGNDDIGTVQKIIKEKNNLEKLHISLRNES
ncbi:MAG: DNA primase [Firmicutes bacterium]|nr:DNA primase [Bacillota bacterium]